jgi:adenylate kinase
MTDQLMTIKSWLGSGSINLFGKPFAGKDTQGRIIADKLDGVLISGGDILRHDHGNRQVQQIMAEGGIIPSDLFEEIVLPYFGKREFEGKPLILSEVGRVLDEADVIMRTGETAGHPLKAVILLHLTDEEVMRRFDASQALHDRGERDDDNRSVLENRLTQFRQKTQPVIDYYRQKDLLIEIDGTQSRDEVSETICSALSNQA